MVDIDHFKRINDRYGHDAGDEVLRAVGGAIAGAVRDGDVPARFGGEEFVVLLRNPSSAVAIEVAERVRSARRPSSTSARPGRLGDACRSGSPSRPGRRSPSPSLLSRADRALYRAKRAGRDRVEAA